MFDTDEAPVHPLLAGAPSSTEFKKLRKRLLRETREALETMAGLREAADTPVASATTEALIAMVEGARVADELVTGLPDEQARLVRAVMQQLIALEV